MSKLIMFDLDGTLVNSVGGIANSVNALRKSFGFSPLPVKMIADFTGDGARILLQRSFADVTLPCSLEDATRQMVQFYAENPLHDTGLYPGVKEGLQALYDAGFILAVVSNKPQTVSEKILTGLGIAHLFSDNLSGGAFPLKPAPDALLFLMDKYKTAPADAWMVGDNHTDINAANAAGIKSIFCKFGFGVRGDAVPAFEAESFRELTNIIQR